MTDDGIVVESTSDRHWAWFGLRLVPVPGMDVDPAADTNWLADQWADDHGLRWDLRYTNTPSRHTVSCVLLGRVHGTVEAEVRAAAWSHRDRLGRMPSHVRAEPVLDAQDVLTALRPGPARPDGWVELRKPLRWAWCARREFDRRVDFAISPLAPRDTGTTPFWDELARLTIPTIVSVYLQPYQVHAELPNALQLLVNQYAEMGAPTSSSPIWTVTPPADPFAAAVVPSYQDAARRYVGRLYKIRVSISAAGPVSAEFADHVAARLGGAVACRPTVGEMAAVWRNMATLDNVWVDEMYRQGAPPGELTTVEQLLCQLADLREATAILHLPYHTTEAPSPFADAYVESPSHDDTRPIHDQDAPDDAVAASPRKRIFVSYVHNDQPAVNLLVHALRAAGYDIWLDQANLSPGMRWRTAIRRAMNSADYFLACFSPQYWDGQTFMEEELVSAVEQLRLEPGNRHWFIPVILEACKVPDLTIGPNETLADIVAADLSQDWDEGLRRIVAALGPPERVPTPPGG